MLTPKPLSLSRLEELLEGIGKTHVALIGDLCLDLYFIADMRLSELSRETPHFPLPIVSERWAPGGAGNAANNIAALQPGKLSVIGVTGRDWRGDLLENAFSERGISTSGVVRDRDVWTNCYVKPLRHGISDVVYEDPRLDFENRAPISADCERRVLDALDRAAKSADAICASDQMRFGCITPAVRRRLCEIGQSGKTVVVDSRDNVREYRHVIVKPNEVEASRAFRSGEALEMDALEALAAEISGRTGRLALITLGGRGSLVADGNAVAHCPACKVEPPIDFCGAGDSFLASFASMLAAGASSVEAAQVATLAASVTIGKIGTTGTATRAEILGAWARCN